MTLRDILTLIIFADSAVFALLAAICFRSRDGVLGVLWALASLSYLVWATARAVRS